MMSHASETTETSLFVILAYIRLIIPSHCCSEIRWCSNWSLAHHSTRCISSCGIFLFIVLCIIVQASINLVIFFSLQFLVRNRDTIFLNNKIQKTLLIYLINCSFKIYLVYFLSLLKYCLCIPILLSLRLKNSCRSLVTRARWQSCSTAFI